MPNGMIERGHPALSIGAQCRLLLISRSSFYHEPVRVTELNLGLMQLIDKQFLDTPFYGVRQDDLASAERGARREPEAHLAPYTAYALDADRPEAQDQQAEEGAQAYPYLARAGYGLIAPVSSGAPT